MSEDFSEKFHKLGDKAIASKNGNGDSQFQFSDEVKLLLQQDVKTRRWRFLALVFIAMFVGLLLYIKFEPQPLLANISALIEPSEKKEQENIGGEGLDHKDRDDKSSVDRSTDTAVHAIPAKVKPDFAPQTRNAPYSTYSWKQGSISDLNNLDTFGESTVLDERLVDAQQPDSWEKVPIINADESEALNDAVGTDNLVLCITGAFGVSSHLRTYFDDYAKQSLDYGVSLVLKRYEDETKAIQDYQDGSCPMLAVSGVRARVFNKFTGSIDSFGAVQTYNSLRIIIETVLSKKAEKFLINNDHEIVVILPGAAQFAFVASRNIVTIESFSNRKIGVSTVTPENRYFARVIGMIPIESGSNTIANKFANGVTDVAMLPTSAFTLKKLEGVFQVGGGILKHPLMISTIQVIAHKGFLAEGFGRFSRQYAAKSFDAVLEESMGSEAEVLSQFGIEMLPDDIAKFQEEFRQYRIALSEQGLLDRKMLTLMRKVRCSTTPSSMECVALDKE